jgi:hypothetical protein
MDRYEFGLDPKRHERCGSHFHRLPISASRARRIPVNRRQTCRRSPDQGRASTPGGIRELRATDRYVLATVIRTAGLSGLSRPIYRPAGALQAS